MSSPSNPFSIRPLSSLACLIGCLAIAGAAALPCRYTVRDIGFVDLVGADYVLRLHASEAALGAAAGPLAEFDPGADSNLRFERVPGAGPTRWSLACSARPELFLEGIDVSAGDLGASAAFERAIGTALLSGISADTLGTFAFAIVVEGTSAEGNESLHELVAEAVERLESVADQLPRPIEWPLRTVAVKSGEREAAAVLLWALGLGPESLEPDENALALVYGRGKLAGPVLIGDEIELNETLGQLVLVGESCECDTDRSWADEPRLPLRWTDRQRADAVASLGFDPDSPMVKGEVTRILALGPKAHGDQPNDSIEALLFGYRETDLVADSRAAPRGGSADPDTTPPDRRRAEVRVVDAGEGDWGFADQGREAADEGESQATRPRFLIVGGSLALILALAGLVVLAGRGGER